jgi:hypothetical protein
MGRVAASTTTAGGEGDGEGEVTAWAQVTTPNPSDAGYFNAIAAIPTGSLAVARFPGR